MISVGTRTVRNNIFDRDIGTYFDLDLLIILTVTFCYCLTLVLIFKRF